MSLLRRTTPVSTPNGLLTLLTSSSSSSSSSTTPWRRTRTSTRTGWTTQRRAMTMEQLDSQRQGRERVVILGSGWAGYGLSRDLDPRRYQIVVVSPRSYFVFTPLLASTSTGTLEFRTALEPVRARHRGRGGSTQFFQGWADAVDFDARTLSIEDAVDDPMQGRALVGGGGSGSHGDGREVRDGKKAHKGKVFDLAWDKLVITVGCYTQTFGTKGVQENAFFLKDVGDARRIRNRLLACFETASLPTTGPEMKAALLNFAVVGGGPTGIEWAAELHDIVAQDLSRLYPDIHHLARITVYDVAPKVLSMFDEKLGAYAAKTFRRQGIDIKTSHHVQELRRGAPQALRHGSAADQDFDACYTLKLQEEGEVGVGMCVWSTGLMMNPFVEKLAGRVKQHPKSDAVLTDGHLRVKRPDDDGSTYENVFALGDCAVLEGTAYPATAQVASQKAAWLAKRLNKGDLDAKSFTYKDLGVMAYTGAGSAILQSQGGDFSGWTAWFVWRAVYLSKCVSWRNRILIPTYWAINWIFGRDVSRF